ncbi:MAG: hypothetical protein MUF38_16535 [Anaerolineae bacterium]|jgi:hypothetical protein|nr:hypothetical protein [Anaerolineae bacterium]
MTRRINWPVVIAVLVVLTVLGVLMQQALFTRFAESGIFSLSHVIPETNADGYRFALQDAQQRSGGFSRVGVFVIEYKYRCYTTDTAEEYRCERRSQLMALASCNLICAMFSSEPETSFTLDYRFYYDNPRTNRVEFSNPGWYVPKQMLDELTLQTANDPQNLNQLIARFREECPASEDEPNPLELFIELGPVSLNRGVVWKVRANECLAQFSFPDHDLAP